MRCEYPTLRISPIAVYRVLNRHGLLGPRTSPKAPQKRMWIRFERAHRHELWQTDLSDWYIEGSGFYSWHTV